MDTTTSASAQATAVPQEGFWEWLKNAVDYTLFRPQRVENVTVQEFEGKRGPYYILRSPEDEYIKMDPPNYFLWNQMNGQNTVTDIVMAYFVEFGNLAFGRLGGLIAILRAKGFLTESPASVYQSLKIRFQTNRLASLAGSVARTFMHREFAISNVDGFFTWLYNHGAKWFFTLPVFALLLIVSLVGSGLFINQVRNGSYALIQSQNSYGFGIVILLIAWLFSIFLHECAHALTTKHYGCRVRRGGFMFYLGMPAFFVDTMDIWMANKKARLAVSAAGPFMNFIVGAVCGIIISVFPNFALNDLLFKTGAMAYLGAVFNLNPLIELDGYFLLMDWLEIPSLRKRAMTFFRGKMWLKLFKRERLSSDERIFAVFGSLATVYTAYMVVFSVGMWQQRIGSVLSNLLHAQGWLPKVLLALIVLAVAILFGIPLALRFYLLLKRAVSWLIARGVFAKKRNLALILLTIVIIMNGFPWLAEAGGRTEMRHALLSLTHVPILVIGLGTLGLMLVSYDRSQTQRTFLSLGLPTLLLLGSEIAFALELPIALWLRWASTIVLLPVALLAFNANDLRLSTQVERAILVFLLLGGALSSLGLTATMADNGVGVDRAVVGGMAVLSGLMTLSLSVPMMGAFLGTSFGYVWGFVSLGVLSLATASALEGEALLAALPVQVRATFWGFGSGFLMAGLVLYYLIQTSLHLPLPVADSVSTFDDRERLCMASRHIVEVVLRQYHGLFGARRAQELNEQLNIVALSARWGVALDRNHLILEDQLLTLTILQQADTLQELLGHLVSDLQRVAGHGFAKAALQRAYDSLPWEQREILGEYVLRNTTWGATLSREFEETCSDHRSLLRGIPLFAQCNEAEMEAIIARLQDRHYSAKATIIHQGEVGKEFYIVKRGRVAVWQKDEEGIEHRVNQHGRGGYFGEVALLKDAPRNATCVAATPVNVLVLERSDFDALVRRYFDIGVKLDQAIQHAQLLSSLPLFSEVETDRLKEIAGRLTQEQVPARTTVFEQGERGGHFYVILEGDVEIWHDQNGNQKLISRRGPGEYFGEIALLRDVPRTASVIAATDCMLLALMREDFLALVQQDLDAQREIERVSSRRLLDLEQQSKMAAAA